MPAGRQPPRSNAATAILEAMAKDLPPRAERRRLTHVDRSGRPRMVDVSEKPSTARRAIAEATVAVSDEMEALTAASVAALTIYDMVKGIERGVEIRSIHLVSKTGGKSGEWHRPVETGSAPAPRHRPGARSAGRIGGKRRGPIG